MKLIKEDIERDWPAYSDTIPEEWYKALSKSIGSEYYLNPKTNDHGSGPSGGRIGFVVSGGKDWDPEWSFGGPGFGQDIWDDMYKILKKYPEYKFDKYCDSEYMKVGSSSQDNAIELITKYRYS